MGRKLSKAPVFYSVAQIQFNPILDMENFISRIQPKMREAGLPDYQRFAYPQLSFTPGNAEPWIAPTMVPQSRFLFGDIEGRSLILVDSNTITYETTAYETFETLLKTLLNGLTILNEILQLSFVERIGLRYLDAVKTHLAGETLRDYLVPEVLGLALSSGDKLQHSLSETAATITDGQLFTRVLIRDDELSLPPDLLISPTARIQDRFLALKGLHAVMDTDAFVSRREAFDLSVIRNRLIYLHDEIDRSFKAIVTKHALASWA